MPKRKDAPTKTSRPSVEEILISELIKERNPGVEFTIQIGENGIEEVLVDGKPKNVDFQGVLRPRVEGEPHWKFYALTDECLNQNHKYDEASHTPPPPVLDHALLASAIGLKNPEKPISCSSFCRGKLVAVYSENRRYKISKNGTLY
ncbi:MAG: hypothetical protein IJH12_08070 [Clostridia bacterium]|nr:hypothetical protein [Clostridia bacterium]